MLENIGGERIPSRLLLTQPALQSAGRWRNMFLGAMPGAQWSNRVSRILWAVALAAAPVAAQANSGIGYFLIALPIVEIKLTPTVDAAAKTLSWKCRSTLPPKWLPATCRE